MTASTGRPLITFALFGYNQEEYIREAVEGAFSQTHEPLEIILSDDCSTDRTFEIIEEMAARYRGPHRVVLNRNAENLGVAEHINRVMSLAQGEWIVAAAGDDISLPGRAGKLSQFAASIGHCDSVCSAVEIINKSGQSLGLDRPADTSFSSIDRAIASRGVGFKGASHCWSRRSFSLFGPVPGRVFCEDKVIGFRSLLLSRIGYIDEPLVKYRRHPNTLSGRRAPRWSYRRFLQHQKLYYGQQALFLRANLSDLQMALRLGLVTAENGARWADALTETISESEAYVSYLSATPAQKRLSWKKDGRTNGLLAQHGWLALARWCTCLGVAGYYEAAIRLGTMRMLSAIRRHASAVG